MRFTTRLTLLFGAVLAVFVASTLPVAAAQFREAVGSHRSAQEWEKVAALWAQLDEDTREKAQGLVAAVEEWRRASAASTLESDARYLRFQTAFLTFSAFQALVLFALFWGGLALLSAPLRKMEAVLANLKSGDALARLSPAGGAEWRNLAQQFNSMLDQNQAFSRLQGWQEVAAFLSHQIKNPLTAMALAEQNVRALVPELPALAAANLDVVASQVRRLNNLVQRLRDLTSFDKMARTPMDLKDFVETWAASRRRQDEVWNLVVGEVGIVALVPLLCEQALDNLLANSREAWAGPEPLGLSLEVRPGSMIELVWSDTNRLAEGVAVEHIGQARFTTKSEGSGLGVFFVRRTAELHGGTLTASTSGSGGLVLSLTLEGDQRGPHTHRR